jgi:hypothetical protein
MVSIPLSNTVVFQSLTTPDGTERAYFARPGSPGTNWYKDYQSMAHSLHVNYDPSTGSSNDIAPSGYKTGPYGPQTINLTGTAFVPTYGLSGGYLGKVVTFKNVGDTPRIFVHESTSSSSTNRFNIPEGFAILMPGDSITFEWGTIDGSNSRWNVLQWPNRGVGMGLTFIDDFLQAGANGIQYYVTGNATVTQSTTGIDTTSKSAGVITLASSNGPGKIAVGHGQLSNTATILPGQSSALVISRFTRGGTAPSAANNFYSLTGFGDINNGGYDDGTSLKNIIAWENSANNTSTEFWYQVTCNNTTTLARSTSGSPSVGTVGGSIYWFIVYLNAAGTAADFIYGDAGVFTLASRISSGLPTIATGIMPLTMVRTTGLPNRAIYADLIGYRLVPGIRG